MTGTTGATYEELVREAFIEPIRSVLIVDDDYPTLDDTLNGFGKENPPRTKRWADEGQLAKVKEVVDEFRKHNGPYILDIHDGAIPDEQVDEENAGRLQPTDLLILDYELDAKADGTAALAMARKTLENTHFNMILVHTQEDLGHVFKRFVIGLLQPLGDWWAEGLEGTEKFDDFLEDNSRDLGDAIGDSGYLELRKMEITGIIEELNERILEGKGIWGPCAVLLKRTAQASEIADDEWGNLVRHWARGYEQEDDDKFADTDLMVKDWDGGETMWIRSAMGFIAFKGKGEKGALLEKLTSALVAWRPHQSRLILSKLRNEMNRRGFELQDDALGGKAVGAGWYYNLLKNKGTTGPKVEAMARNHSEQLIDQLIPDVVAYANRLLAADADADPIEAVKATFEIDLSQNEAIEAATIGHNAFVGSKPVNGDHLDFGHIVELNGLYWVCMTPACDMVPKRYREMTLQLDHNDGKKRFSAVRLRETSIGGTIQGGNIPKAFGNTKYIMQSAEKFGTIFSSVDKEDGGKDHFAFQISAEAGSAPVWTTMYALNDGCFKTEGNRTIEVQYVRQNNNEGAELDSLEIASGTARVCGQLRYEYALNVQAFLMRSLSRIGLDFLST